MASWRNGTGVLQGGECISRTLVHDRVVLMIGIHVDDVHVDNVLISGEKGACDKYLDELRQRFPSKNSVC